jgi:hypothetical protein
VCTENKPYKIAKLKTHNKYSILNSWWLTHCNLFRGWNMSICNKNLMLNRLPIIAHWCDEWHEQPIYHIHIHCKIAFDIMPFSWKYTIILLLTHVALSIRNFNFCRTIHICVHDCTMWFIKLLFMTQL